MRIISLFSSHILPLYNICMISHVVLQLLCVTNGNFIYDSEENEDHTVWLL